MNLTINEIINVLNKLGIQLKNNNPNSKGWLSILCPSPYHNDKHFGNCSININNGVVKCLSCGYTKNIYSVVMDNLKCSYKEALDFIDKDSNYFFNIKKIKDIKKEDINKKITQNNEYNFAHIELNPDIYHYTKSRNITKEFCEYFKIRHALSGLIDDYFIIPIIDIKKNIYEYEARKLKEYEILKKILNKEASLEELKINFKNYCVSNNIKNKNNNLYINEEVYYNTDIKYIFKSKTFYIKNSRCKETLWNIDNLSFSKPLYVVEGLGSICKIWSNISKNVTAIFGANISEAQINYLKNFDIVYFIPDHDKAGYSSVEILNKQNLQNVHIIDIVEKDIHTEYVYKILNTPHISIKTYLLKNFKKFKLF